MIVLSNHLSRLFPPPPDSTIRVNLAWYSDRGEAENAVLAHNTKHHVFLDFPDGRSKPPQPTLTLDEAIAIANGYECVKYFAVSNSESIKRIKEIQGKLRKGIVFVPKIETKKGVMQMDLMVIDAGVRTMMLDKEDLYVDLKRSASAFDAFVNLARAKAQALNITLLELQGVVFA